MKKLFTLILILSATYYAQAQLIISGEFRPRTEFNHGYKAPMALDNQMFSMATTQRTRLGINFNIDHYRFGLQLQDVRAWGATKQLVSGDGAFTTVHQAWGEVFFNENLSLKLGRQELVYDDHRILGSVGWAQQARSHDLALLKYEKKGAFKLHFGTAVNQSQPYLYPVAGNYKSMQFLWFNKKMSDHYTLSVLALNNGVQDTSLNVVGVQATTYSQIIGQRSVYKNGKLVIGLNLYYQMGSDKAKYKEGTDFKHNNIAAYNARLDVSYKATKELKVTLGYEVLSGNSQTDTTASYSHSNHAFTPLYGTNHKFNGWMDYFYVGNHINTVGLSDAYLQLDYNKNKFLAGAHFHSFSAAADVLDTKEFATSGKIQAMAAGLGTEVDTYVGYKYAPGVLFKAGWSVMMDSETMRSLKGGNANATNHWGWIMMVIKPNFTVK